MKKFLNNKLTKVIVVSIMINILLIFLINHSLDLLSVIVYSLVGLLWAYIFINSKPFKYKFFVIGLLISLTYNFGGVLANLFAMPLILIILNALIQGAIMFIVSKLMRDKK